MKETSQISFLESIIAIFVAPILGTIFTFGTRYWHAPITHDEAYDVTATFSSYKESLNKYGDIQEIIIRFEDHKQLYIDGTCINDSLCDAISKINPGDIIEMMVHPNSNDIMEMYVGQTKLMDFQNSVEMISSDIPVFTALGIFCYLTAIMCYIHLLRSDRK